jgi:hypothetical protein
MPSVFNFDEFDSVVWLLPWQPAAPGPEFELAKEVHAQHPLYPRTAVTVARRIDNDDVLFFLRDNEPPLAVVHLTWRGSPESSPERPATKLFSSISDWIENCLTVDYLEYSAGEHEP